jgi:hypothetical protein
MAGRTIPGRRGVSKNFTMDADAVALLDELVTSKKGHGRFLSALLRAEQARREERRKLKEAVLQVFEKPVCP